VFCSAALLLVIPAGLATRRYGDHLPNVIAQYGGDTLWALAAFLVLGLVFAGWSRTGLASVAFAVSCVVELSQLLHPEWLEALRRTWLGARLLGHGFLWSDLVCYGAGIAIGVALDACLVGRTPDGQETDDE
jgi:hypothetical protein